jgi:hypothetical protein
MRLSLRHSEDFQFAAVIDDHVRGIVTPTHDLLTTATPLTSPAMPETAVVLDRSIFMLQIFDNIADLANAAAIPGIKIAASLALSITNIAKVGVYAKRMTAC